MFDTVQYRERLQRALTALEDLAGENYDYNRWEHHRLLAKKEGVALALSYLDEMDRV